MSAIFDPAAVTGRIPHYSGVAAVTGSLIFLALIAAGLAVALRKRRR